MLLVSASKSLSLTTVTPGVGLKKTPNSISLIHVIVQLVTKEIDMINRQCDCTKLNYAFYVLRNAIHNHECRVVISKVLNFFSILLQFKLVHYVSLIFLIYFTEQSITVFLKDSPPDNKENESFTNYRNKLFGVFDRLYILRWGAIICFKGIIICVYKVTVAYY